MVLGTAAKNFSFIGIGKTVGLLVQGLFYLLFAALLEPESYGHLSVIIALAGTFATVSRFGLGYTLQVNQSKKKSELTDQVKTLFIILTGTAALILLTIDIFAAALCIGISFYLMNQQNLLGLHQYKKFMTNSLLRSGMFFVIPILLFYVFEIPGLVLGMAIASFVPSIPFFKDLKIKSFFDLKNCYRVLIQNFLVESSGLVTTLDKLLISYLFGLFTVGVYQFNLQILMVLQALPGVLFSYLISEEASGATHKKISFLVILVSFIMTGMTIVLSPIFVNEFFPKYSDGIFSLQIIVLAIIPQSIGSVFSAKLIARESTRIGFVSLINVGTILILIALLGEIYGLIGLSMAVLLSATINVILTYFLYRLTKQQSFQ